MNNRLLFFIFVYAWFLYPQKVENFYIPPFTQIEEYKKRTTVLVKDAKGELFIIKTHGTSDSAIKELVSAHIADSIGIPLNKVQLLDTFCYRSKKRHGLCTIHTFAPGQPVGDIFAVHDFSIRLDSFLHGKGNLLEAMTFSGDIPSIVALDLFLANADRHNWNIFVNNNHFCGIDMNGIYFLVPQQISIICSKLKLILKEDSSTKKEQHALYLFYMTLQKFIEYFPAEKIIEIWYDTAQQCKINYRDKEKETLEHQIKETYSIVKGFVQDIKIYF